MDEHEDGECAVRTAAERMVLARTTATLRRAGASTQTTQRRGEEREGQTNRESDDASALGRDSQSNSTREQLW